MIVISSPSGVGKSTISRLLHEDGDMNLSLSISITTRNRRPSEIDNIHYHFVSRREFEYLRDNGELIEWAEVHGNYYATSRKSVVKILKEGQDMLLDIDYQGAAQLRQKMPRDVISIFMLPPSIKELKSRLHLRAADNHQTINLRLENARMEMQHWQNYDYILINENLDRSLAAVKAIIMAERLRYCRQLGLNKLVDKLINEEL